jgi:hypothetical protein
MGKTTRNAKSVKPQVINGFDGDSLIDGAVHGRRGRQSDRSMPPRTAPCRTVDVAY